MERNSIRRWCGACLLGVGLLSGCRHMQAPCSNCNNCNSCSSQPMAMRRPMQSGSTQMACQVIRTPQQMSQCQWKACPPSCTPVMTDRGPAIACVPEAPSQVQTLPGYQPQTPAESDIQRVAHTTPGEEQRQYTTPSHSMFPRGPREKTQHSSIDHTAHPCMDHAKDYSWLSGQVMYSRLSKGWVLRYASLEDDDAYGGSVTLVGGPQLDELKDLQYVRVRGHLRNADARTRDTQYIVDALELIDP